MTDTERIRQLAIDHVCPHSHQPTTEYEKGFVDMLVRFGEDVVIALGMCRTKGTTHD